MLVRTLSKTFRKMNEFEQFVARKIMNDLLEECRLPNVGLCKQWFPKWQKYYLLHFFLKFFMI